MRYFTLIMIIAFAVGCGGGNPASVDVPSSSGVAEVTTACEGHQLWGLWNVRIKADGSEFEVVPLRHAQLHLNAVRFLEPPPGQYLKLNGAWVSEGLLNVDIELKHPMYGQTQFTGFDVKGIVILPGSDHKYSSDFIVKPGLNETRLVNPDGMTRWWNPKEFPPDDGQPIFGYMDGLLGAPDDEADYLTTINSYKYFADGLGPITPLSALDASKRGMFSVFSIITRRYKFKVQGPEIVFNYAVDASWAKPTPVPPAVVPDDFPIQANQPEAWRVDIEEIENTLYNDGTYGGGRLFLDVTVFSHRPWEANRQVTVEGAEGAFGPVGASEPVSWGEGWAKYELRVHGACPKEPGALETLVRVESTLMPQWGGYIYGWLPLAAYFIHQVDVGTTPQGGGPLELKGFYYEDSERVDVDDPVAGKQNWTVGGAGYYGNHLAMPFYACEYSGPKKVYVFESFDGGQAFEHYIIDDTYGDLFVYAVIDPFDNVHIFMQGGLRYSRRLAGEDSYSPIIEVLQETPDSLSPPIAAKSGSDGRIHLVYCELISPPPSYVEGFCYTYTDDYSDFAAPEVLLTLPEKTWADLMAMGFALGENDELHLVWVERTETYQARVKYSHGFLGNMSEPVWVDVGSTGDDKYAPRIGIGPDGSIHVAWLYKRESPLQWPQYQVYYAYSPDGESFQPQMQLTYEGVNTEIARVELVVDAHGIPQIFYTLRTFDLGQYWNFPDSTIKRVAVNPQESYLDSPVRITDWHFSEYDWGSSDPAMLSVAPLPNDAFVIFWHPPYKTRIHLAY